MRDFEVQCAGMVEWDAVAGGSSKVMGGDCGLVGGMVEKTNPEGIWDSGIGVNSTGDWEGGVLVWGGVSGLEIGWYLLSS
jgi:hypothetical protein